MIKKVKNKSRDEWLKLRKCFIGGSECSSVVGMNPYKSAYSLWAEKTGKIPAFDGNLITEVGIYLEDFVAKLFERETGKKVRRDNHSIFNDKYPWAIADIDRSIVGENAILEIKTSNSIPIIKQIKKGDVYGSWWCQLMHYMAVIEAEKAYLAVLVNCREFYWFEIERDQAEIDALMNAEREFWKLVETDTPPATDGDASTTETLTTIYPKSNGDTVNLFGYDNELKQYINLQAQIKALTDLKDEMANKVKAYMKEASRAESDNYKVSWASSERKTFDVKKFSSDHPKINLDDYYKVSSVRTFKVTERN